MQLMGALNLNLGRKQRRQEAVMTADADDGARTVTRVVLLAGWTAERTAPGAFSAVQSLTCSSQDALGPSRVAALPFWDVRAVAQRTLRC